MDQLLSKLSNLGYEFLGIVLPGLIALILLVFWLVGLGELLPLISSDFFPRFTLSSASRTLETLGVRTGMGVLGPILLIAYFLGHLLHWISRTGVADDAYVKDDLRRTCSALVFSVPKPSHSYNQKLQPLLDAVIPSFSLPGDAGWRQFYPVAKNYLARTSNTSLVNLYQNKYTLHRSITAGAALIFWLSVAAMAFGVVIAMQSLQGSPRWVPLLFLELGCLTLVWGFSDSYAYNWEMFGNSIITETFSLLNSPVHAKS